MRRDTVGFALIGMVIAAAIVLALAYSVLITYFKQTSAPLPVTSDVAAGVATNSAGSGYVGIVKTTAASLENIETQRQQDIEQILNGQQ
jgi:hypothetical protein